MAAAQFTIDDEDGGRGAAGSGSPSSASSALVSHAHAPQPFPPLTIAAKLSWPARFFVSFVFLGGLTAFATPSPLTFIAAYYVSLIPSLLSYTLIIHHLPDPSITPSFLLTTMFISSVPLILLTSIIELLITFIAILTVLGGDATVFAEQYIAGISNLTNVADGASPSPAGLSPDQREAMKSFAYAFWRGVRDQIPLWKLLAILFLLAYLVAALTEEVAKYGVARRHRVIPSASVRGVVATFAASAVGFAGAEHVLYATGYVARMGLLSALSASVARAFIAFPLHVGTTFWIGTRAARYAVLKERVSFWKSIAVAVFFHGTLDAVAFLGAAEESNWPALAWFVLPIQAALVVALMTLGRRAFLKVVEEERIILDAEEADLVARESGGGKGGTSAV